MGGAGADRAPVSGRGGTAAVGLLVGGVNILGDLVCGLEVTDVVVAEAEAEEDDAVSPCFVGSPLAPNLAFGEGVVSETDTGREEKVEETTLLMEALCGRGAWAEGGGRDDFWSFVWQLSQIRWGSLACTCGMSFLCVEHFAHTTEPHSLQWCLRLKRVKDSPQISQALAALSGFQTGA